MSDLVEDLQIIAFRDVAVGTNEAWLRWLYRWYSKNFSTPLHTVSSLPLTDILTAFWEEKYWEMDTDELEDERQRLLETPEERLAKKFAKEADEHVTDALAAALEAELLKAQTTPPPQRIEDLKLPTQQAIKTRDKIPEAVLPEPKLDKLPESVSIRFAPTDFFDELADRLDDASAGEDPNLLGKSPHK